MDGGAMTHITIHHDEFHLDGQPTYAGRIVEGHKIQGLLFNVRAVQATFDDANPVTRDRWRYPDTGVWDPDRNTADFCAALSSWREHGVRAFTINFQGGGPIYTPDVYEHFDNNGFTPHGELKPAYSDRIQWVIRRADELGMAVIVGLFYWKQVQKMADEAAIWRAAENAVDFLAATGHHNLLIEIANETDIPGFGHAIFQPTEAHRMIAALRKRHPQFLYSTSQVGANPETGRGLPPPSLVKEVDFVFLHGNGCDPARLERAIHTVQAMPQFQSHPKPLIINEDSPGLPNLEVAWRNYVSWGYYDQGFGSAWKGDRWVPYYTQERETEYNRLSGFQTLPVNWAINTEHKRAFFERVAEITGMRGECLAHHGGPA
jgi:hypothetical protein